MAVITATRVTRTTSSRPVWVVGLGATVVGALVLLAYGAVAVAAVGPLRAGDPGASHSVPLNAGSFAIGVLFCGVLGSVIAAGIARWAADPARTFVRAAVVLTAVSLVPPVFASHTDLTSKLTLVIGHLIAAAVIIPLISRRLRAS